MKIHKAGYKIIAITFLILIIFNYLIYKQVTKNIYINSAVQIWSAITFILIVFFFRNPDRKIIENPYFIISPADGKIIEIKEIFEHEYYKENMLMISIFMSLFNVHKNWVPTSGKVLHVQHVKGKFKLAYDKNSYLDNEHNIIAIHNVLDRKILVRQVAGKIARRIYCKIKPNDTIKQGRELGFIKFGSRVDVVLPLDAKVKVKLNQKVYGGLTVLADLYQKKN